MCVCRKSTITSHDAAGRIVLSVVSYRCADHAGDARRVDKAHRSLLARAAYLASRAILPDYSGTSAIASYRVARRANEVA